MDPRPDPASLLTGTDLAVFFLLLGLTFAAVVWGHRRRGKGDSFLDHLLMGRSLTLPFFTATLVATWYGGIFGVTEIAFKHGVYNFITQGVFWYATYLIFAFFLVHRIAAYKAVTLPELVGRMFGPRSAKLAAVFNLFNVLPIAYAISMGLLLQTFLHWPLPVCIALGTFFVIIYSLWGGFRAVVYSDLVQFVIMCGAVLLVVLAARARFGGLDFLMTNLPASHFEPMGGQSWGTLIVWGLIALSTLVDPTFYQRCFAAESPATARKGIFIATIIWCGFDMCTTLGAMYARAVIPAADPQKAYLLFSLQLLPEGLRGFFLAGIAATVLSTLDSYLFIASTTVSYDLLPERLGRNLSASRLSTLSVGVIAIVLSGFFDGSVEAVWKTLGSYSAGCLLIPMMVGHWRPGLISDTAFLTGALCGAAAITYGRLGGSAALGIDSLYYGLAGNVIGLTAASAFWPSGSSVRKP